MKTKKTIILGFFISLAFILIPVASAICSLGASPLEISVRASPGQTAEIEWNFINLRGDRDTHVLISQSKGPDWKVVYSPQAQTRKYDVSGIEQEIVENFEVPVSEIVLEKPEPLPSGKLAYIVHPDVSLGYILVDRQSKILITIPDDAKIGETEEFVFTALGRCFGEVGAVTASVATELKVKITPTSQYYEKSIQDKKPLFSEIFDFITKPAKVEPLPLLLFGTSIILFLILFILLLSARRKRRKSKRFKK